MAQKAQSPHTGDLIADTPELTLQELCRACGLSQEQVEAYVAERIVEPRGRECVRWRFSHMSLIAARRARRLERDLDLNAAGVAVAFDLMAQLDVLKSRLALLEHNVEGALSES